MFTKEEVDSWNELFPDCKIRESDLSHPTEGFLTKTLIAYLRLFGYKVEPPSAMRADDQPQTREKRLFLIKLTRQIDSILKITTKSYTFSYYDILRPTFKKTSHMLGILLNYLYYHNMYKTDVFKMTNELIIEYQELQQGISLVQAENEQWKEKTTKRRDEISELCEQVPVAKAKLEMLNTRKEAGREEMQKLQDLIKGLNIKAEELKAQKRNLKIQVVRNEEAQELQAQYTKLQEDISERQALEIDMKNSLKKLGQNLDAVEKLIKSVESVKETVPLKLLESFKDINKKLKETTDKYNSFTSKKQKLLNVVEKRGNELNILEENYKLKQQQFEQEKKKNLQIIAKEKHCNVFAAQLIQLKHEVHFQESALQEQRDIRDFIQKHIAEIFSAYN